MREEVLIVPGGMDSVWNFASLDRSSVRILKAWCSRLAALDNLNQVGTNYFDACSFEISD